MRDKMFAMLIMFISLLGSAKAIGSSHGGLATFAIRIELELKDKGFSAQTFCHQFWLGSQRSTCLAIPWDYVLKSGVTLEKVIPIQDDELGFFLFKINGVMNQLFSVTINDVGFFLSLDHPLVWQHYSKDWVSAGHLRFSSEINDQTGKVLNDSIVQFHEKIQKTFQISRPLVLPFYFLNSSFSAAELGFVWDENKLGGGAREGFIFIVGDIRKNLRSTLLHELVHSYTAYPGDFWKGPGIFPNALLSEGLATWVQIPEAWNDDVPKEMMARALCRDILNVRKKLSSGFFDLLDNNHFRAFDGMNGSFKSGYIAGAALIDALMKDLKPSAFRHVWNQLGRQTDPEQMRAILTSAVPEGQLLEQATVYLNQFESEIANQAHITCVPK